MRDCICNAVTTKKFLKNHKKFFFDPFYLIARTETPWQFYLWPGLVQSKRFNLARPGPTLAKMKTQI